MGYYLSGLYCWDPLAVRGANPGMKKWSRGKGTMLTASFLKHITPVKVRRNRLLYYIMFVQINSGSMEDKEVQGN